MQTNTWKVQEMSQVHVSHAVRVPAVRRVARKARAGLVGTIVASALAVGGAVASASAVPGAVDLPSPPGSGCFGYSVTPLTNGNLVITDPCWNGNIGAVYLYDGRTHTMISALTGTISGDRVGSGPVKALLSGNFVASSPQWDNAGAVDAGAVTWGNGTTGITGAVSAANSLVGSTALDELGKYGVEVLKNGNYVVGSPYWNNGAVADVGASTWGDGKRGVSGVISAANSLIGTTASDLVGWSTISLANGNYVSATGAWHNGAAYNAGAATWVDGSKGITGPVSPANSLVGSSTQDSLGAFQIAALPNGNYVVTDRTWDNGAVQDVGAAVWADGTKGVTGPVTAANAFMGTKSGDQVGGYVVPLANGNYVMGSQSWGNGAAQFAGAVTWANGATGITGTLSEANSLVGTTTRDSLGSDGIVALSNGNYLVAASKWDNGAIVDAGSVTWADGTTGKTGPVSPTRSLVGTKTGDQVGRSVTALTNGNYVVSSFLWDNGFAVDAGAVTWGNGTTGIVGPVTAEGSLVGTTSGDNVGSSGVTALPNGNYVVPSTQWDNGAVKDAGAVTWGNGSTGTTGPVTVANSFVGSQTYDSVGLGNVAVLANGNYVVQSLFWDNGTIADVGAVTWARGTGGTVGAVSAANSLVGTSKSDSIGWTIVPLSNGNYVVGSRTWDNGPVEDAGAVTWANGLGGTVGAVSAANSFVGSTAGDSYGGYITALDSGDAAVFGYSWDSPTVQDVGAVTIITGGGPSAGVVSADNSFVGSVKQGGYLSVAVTTGGSIYVGRPGDGGVVSIIPKVVSLPPGPGGAGAGFRSVVPARLLETRQNQPVGTVDGLLQGGGRVAAGSVTELPVAGRGGVGADPSAVVLNVAVTAPEADGYVTVFPCGGPVPTASSLNFAAGQTISNAVTAAVGTGGAVCVFSFVATDVIVDVVGWFPPGSGFVAGVPARVLETRSGQPVGTVDGQQENVGVLPAGSVTEVQIAGRAGVPADAVAAVLNVAVTEPQAAGFLTVFPCGAPQPTASSLNHEAGQTIANMVVAKLGVDGKICVFTYAPAHVVIDVDGYHTAGSGFVGSSPQRIVETRPAAPVGTVDGVQSGGGLLSAGSVLEVPVAGRAGVPAGASTVVLNVAVTESQAAGFVTVFPCGAPLPTASSLNHATAQTIANNVTAKIGDGGRVCVYTHATTHVVIDLAGYYA